jgi:hypothetical protein
MRKQIAVCVVCASTIGIAYAAEQSVKSKASAQGMFQLKATNDHITLEANDAALAKIFEEIGKQAEIIIESNLGPEEKITIQLNHVPLQEGLNRLARNVTVVYAQAPNEKRRRISKAIVLDEGTTEAPPSNRTKTSTELSEDRRTGATSFAV